MAKYFVNYPKIIHSFDGKTGVVVTNLLTRIKMSDSVLKNTLAYYKYDIQEGDTPEIIAEKYYGDAEKHWLVLMSNQIIDPFYEWPMTFQQFSKFINSKYGSQSTALSTIHHYEKIIDTTDSYTGLTTRNTYQIDQTTYDDMNASPVTVSKSFGNGKSITVTTSRKSVNCYEYEDTLNDSKRTINLLNSKYARQAEKELMKLLGVEEL